MKERNESEQTRIYNGYLKAITTMPTETEELREHFRVDLTALLDEEALSKEQFEYICHRYREKFSPLFDEE